MYEIRRRIFLWSVVILTVPKNYQVTVLNCGALMIKDENKCCYKCIASGEWHSAGQVENKSWSVKDAIQSWR